MGLDLESFNKYAVRGVRLFKDAVAEAYRHIHGKGKVAPCCFCSFFFVFSQSFFFLGAFIVYILCVN